MTTAHRPTWAPAKGGEEQGGSRFYAPSQMRSVKDIAGFTTMKYRQEGQGSIDELKANDLKAKLEQSEKIHYRKIARENFDAERNEDLKLLESGVKTAASVSLVPSALDADIDSDEEEDDEEPGSEESEDDDDDDEAELLAELDRIRKERQEEAARKAAEENQQLEAAEMNEMLAGNPLLADKLRSSNGPAQGSFALKRRWDDDVIFRNQARNEPKKQRRFINDTLRSDFHRRFLERYIK